MPEKANLSPVFLKQLKNTVDRILNVPGNYTKGKVLEMTVVIDKNLSKEILAALLPEVLRSLKTHDRVFQNVRFHAAYWETDEKPEDKVLPMTMAMLDGFYEGYAQRASEKSVLRLAQYLSLFHARSKLIILLTDGSFKEEGREEIKKSMQPFLEKKLMRISIKEGSLQQNPLIGYREW